MGSSFALVRESPLANRVTSWPSSTSSSVSQETTRSVPPYSFGGIASVSGAICAIRIHLPPGFGHFLVKDNYGDHAAVPFLSQPNRLTHAAEPPSAALG